MILKLLLAGQNPPRVKILRSRSQIRNQILYIGNIFADVLFQTTSKQTAPLVGLGSNILQILIKEYLITKSPICCTVTGVI